MSSDDSMDDEIPIKYLPKAKRITKHGHSSAMEALLKRKQLECEFCNTTCYNMYHILVHNASHMMVLLKHGIPRCKRCNVHFASHSQLEIHNSKKHCEVPYILKDKVKPKPVKEPKTADTICINTSTFKSLNCITMGTKPTPVVHLIGKQPVIRCEDMVTRLIKGDTVIDGQLSKVITTLPLVTTNVNIPGVKITKPTPVVQLIGKQPVIRCEDMVTRLIKGDTVIDDQLPKVITNLPLVTTNVDMPGVKAEEVDTKSILLDVINESLVVRCDDTVTKLLNGDCKPESLKHEYDEDTNTPSKSNVLNIKSKIMFEDEMEDVEEDIIIVDDNAEVFDLTASDSDNNDDQEFRSNRIVLGTKVSTENNENEASLRHKKDEPIFEVNFSPSVHYEDLMESGLFACRFCRKTFPNNYQKITHEVIHMRINPRPNTLYLKVRVCQFCDQYIAGNHYNLKRHHLEEHLQLDGKAYDRTPKTCDKCHLRYFSYGRHFFKYHLIYTCPRCSKPYEKESALADHKTRCSGLKYSQEQKISEWRTIQLCEVCSIFHLKSRRCNYKLVGQYSKEGQRVSCQACNKKCFEVKLLRFVCYRKNSEYQCKNKAPITNEIRLKNIQQRLKNLKLLSKR